jgi:hypothetical protein
VIEIQSMTSGPIERDERSSEAMERRTRNEKARFSSMEVAWKAGGFEVCVLPHT